MAKAMRVVRSLAGKLGLANSTKGPLATLMIGVRSLVTLYGMLLNKLGAIVIEASAANSKV